MKYDLYAGLAGETASYPGYPLTTGLFRSSEGSGPWERVGDGLPPDVEVRALVTHPSRRGVVFAGTQYGIYRSVDRGERWKLLAADRPTLGVWSLVRHPRHPDGLLAGYEAPAVAITSDAGDRWQLITIDCPFPEITCRPRMFPKRVIDISAAPHQPGRLYAAIEVGGLLRSDDEGSSWRTVETERPANDDPFDLHGVCCSPTDRDVVWTSGRLGVRLSTDGGATLATPSGAPITYSRAVRYAPWDPATIYVCGGAAFDAGGGFLHRSRDGGRTWTNVSVGAPVAQTMFALELDTRAPGLVCIGTYGGEVFTSFDDGETWRAHPLPLTPAQIYAMAIG